MWTNMNDVLNDLSKLNDFGDSKNSERYKGLCSEPRKGKATKKPVVVPEILDPRTGETISICTENRKKKEKRFGFNSSAMDTLRYEHELHNQLQLVRKMRPCDQQVEDYFNNDKTRASNTSNDNNKYTNKSVGDRKKVKKNDHSTGNVLETKTTKIPYCKEGDGSVLEFSKMEITENKEVKSKWGGNTAPTKMPRMNRNVLVSTLLARSMQLKEAKKNEKRMK